MTGNLKRYHIAVLLSQADSTYQKNLLQGLLTQAYELNIDVAVFAPFLKEGSPDNFSEGETCIYSLPDFRMFDGIILVPDTIKDKAIVGKLVHKIKESKTPCVTIDYELEGFDCVWNDDALDIERLVDHLIDVHGCKTIDFFSGFEGHPHSVHREEGYRRSLAKHGIELEEERIHHGDFWRFKGEEVADDILSGKRPLPDGIACVCDHSAEALADALVKRGIKIPEEIKIVGYDATFFETKLKSDVTSMLRSSSVGGAEGVARLYEKITGQKTGVVRRIEHNSLIISKSCGCKEEPTPEELACNFSSKPDSNSIYDIDPNDFYSGYNFMMEDLVRVDNYHDFLWLINWFKKFITDLDDMYFCLCDSWKVENQLDGSDEKLSAYTNTMYMVYRFENGEGKVELDGDGFDKNLLLPGFFDNDEGLPSVYYFSPLHFVEKCFGYNVLRYINKPIVFNKEYASWIRNVGCAFEALRRHMKLKLLNSRLEKMYETLEEFSVTDQLTGINNRNAYNSYLLELNERGKPQNLFVLVADLNNLKPINDLYGHNEGDRAICVAAAAVRKACKEGDRAFRIGGDEFVLIGTGAGCLAGTEEYVAYIEEHINERVDSLGLPYTISISVGCSCSVNDECNTMEELVNIADKRMYENKKRIKKRLGIKRQ